MLKLTKKNVSFIVNDTTANAGFWLNHYSRWEPSTFDFIIPRLAKDKTFIDIGAWIGPITMVAAHYSKSCICFEPDPVAHAELIEHVQLNNLTNVYVEQKAVSLDSELTIGSAALGESITRDSCTINAFTVGCFTPEMILEKYMLKEQDISVIKIDVEGHEQQLLKDHSILWDLNVPFHLSFHPGWKADKEQFYSDVTPFLIHKKVDVTNLRGLGDFFDITIN